MPEVCVGMVKPTRLFENNPNQHAADLVMLHDIPELQLVLTDKPIDCICVDRATDEGPSHKEVQFVWTEHHLIMVSYVPLFPRDSVAAVI
jgi:hypothetical protein